MFALFFITIALGASEYCCKILSSYTKNIETVNLTLELYEN